jgi:hypothetical protein
VSPHCFTTYLPEATRDLTSGFADTACNILCTSVFVPFSLLLQSTKSCDPLVRGTIQGVDTEVEHCLHSKAGQGASRVQGFSQVKHQHIETSFAPSPRPQRLPRDRPRRPREHPSRTSPRLSHDVVFKINSVQYLDHDNSHIPRILYHRLIWTLVHSASRSQARCTLDHTYLTCSRNILDTTRHAVAAIAIIMTDARSCSSRSTTHACILDADLD